MLPKSACAVLLICGASFFVSSATVTMNLDKFWQSVASFGGKNSADNRKQLDKVLADAKQAQRLQVIKSVNAYVNSVVTYEVDDVVWKESDYWASPAELLGRGQGDCEDYAIAKYILLMKSGVPEENLRLIYVKAKIGGRRSSVTQAHMVLGYFHPGASQPLILDSLVDEVLPARDRTDLTPVFSFNSQGLWGPGNQKASGSSTAKLSRWRNVFRKLELEGITLG